MQKRIRVFAGPNGSGKSTIIPQVTSSIEEKRLGVFVNADEIEKTIRENSSLNFDTFKLEIDTEQIQDFFRHSSFSPISSKDNELWQKMSIENNTLQFQGSIDSYIAADLADFIRRNLVKNQASFTFETVLSHTSKLDFLEEAKTLGYKVYLYYIATEDPAFNIERVRMRILKNGHPVSDEAIRRRYYRSLDNLREAVMKSNRAYLFDNTGQFAELVAEVTNGVDVKLIDPDRVPEWVAHYLLQLDN